MAERLETFRNLLDSLRLYGYRYIGKPLAQKWPQPPVALDFSENEGICHLYNGNTVMYFELFHALSARFRQRPD